MKYIKIDNCVVKIHFSEETKRYYIDHETRVDTKMSVCYPVVSGATIDELIKNIAKKCEKQNLNYSLVK